MPDPARPSLSRRLMTTTPRWFLRADLLAIVAAWYALLASPWLIRAETTMSYVELSLERGADGSWTTRNVRDPTGRVRAQYFYTDEVGRGWRRTTLAGLRADGSTWDTQRTLQTVLTDREVLRLWSENLEPGADLAFRSRLIQAARDGRAEVLSGWWVRVVLFAGASVPAPVALAALVLGMVRESRRGVFRRRIARAEEGRCPVCGYEHAEHEDGRPCPECGAVSGEVLREARLALGEPSGAD